MMRWKWLLLGVLLVLMAFVLYHERVAGEREGYESGYDSILGEFDIVSNSDYMRFDYPLIDFDFNDGGKWVVIAESTFSAENWSYVCLIDDPQVLEQIKRDFLVGVIQPGRGTTPYGHVCIYRDGKLMENIQHLSICTINRPEVDRWFKKASRRSAERLIGGEIYPPF